MVTVPLTRWNQGVVFPCDDVSGLACSSKQAGWDSVPHRDREAACARPDVCPSRFMMEPQVSVLLSHRWTSRTGVGWTPPLFFHYSCCVHFVLWAMRPMGKLPWRFSRLQPSYTCIHPWQVSFSLEPGRPGNTGESVTLSPPPPNSVFHPFWFCHSGSLGECLRRNASESRTGRRRDTSVLQQRRRSADFDDVDKKPAGNHHLCGTDTGGSACRRAAGRESEHRRGGRLGPGELPVQRHAAGQPQLSGTRPASSRW